ncbi:MAG: FecR domain-containing protein [Balneolaceae bacterium]
MEKNDSNTGRSDQDRELARAFGKVLNREQPKSDLLDPLYKILGKVRKTDLDHQREIPVQGKETAWDSIMESIKDTDTNTRQRNPTPVSPIQTRRTWLKAAAAIVLVALSSIYLVLQFSYTSPAVVAEAGSDIETVDLADGTRVTLRPNSRLYEESVTESQHTYSLTGEALFDVESSDSRTFSVESGPGRIVVTGTRFSLNDREESAQVYLIEGSVRFETTNGSTSVDLQPGDASEINREMQITGPFSFESEIVTGWTENRLTFRDRQAGSILRELEFHFNIDISAPQNVRNETLGGTIQLDSAQQSLDDLGTVLGGSFEQTGENKFEFAPGDTN